MAIIDAVRCPLCCAEKGERCRRFSRRAFGVETGVACGPHRERLALYRRRLDALRISRAA